MQQEFFALLQEARTDGRTVFLSSHLIGEVEKSCGRVAIIRDGRLVPLDRVEALHDLSVHQVELRFAAPVPTVVFAAIPGVSRITSEDHVLHLHVPTVLPALPTEKAEDTPVMAPSPEPIRR